MPADAPEPGAWTAPSSGVVAIGMLTRVVRMMAITAAQQWAGAHARALRVVELTRASVRPRLGTDTKQ